MARIRRNRTIFASMTRPPDRRVAEAPEIGPRPMTARTAARLVPINEVQPGDVLLHGPDDTPDPESNTVKDVDGFPGMWIIDFTNGTASPPVGNGSVYVARLITAGDNDDERDSAEEKWQSDNDDGKDDPDGDGDIDKGPNANSTDGDGDNEDDDSYGDHGDPEVGKAGDNPKKESRLKVLARREAMILNAMPLATLAEQQRLMADLSAIRSEASAIDAAARSIDLANAVVADHLTPITSAMVRSTGSSDWLDTIATPDFTRTASHTMVVEAGQFYRNLHPAVKADAEELVIQAMGRARQVAGSYTDADGAVSVFMTEIVRLAEAVPLKDPSEDGAAGSTLPDAVNPSDAPETFDDDTLSATSARRAAPPIRTKGAVRNRDAYGDVSYTWINENGERYHAAGLDDNGPSYSGGGYDPLCSWCYLGAAHTQAAHALNVEKNGPGPRYDDPGLMPQGTFSSRKTAGNPYAVGTSAWFDYEYNPTQEIHDSGAPGGGIPLHGDLTPEQQAWMDKGRKKKSTRRVAANIDTLRQIVESKTAGNIGGSTVDLFSASGVLQVFDALAPENQAKFGQIIESNIAQAVDVAFKLINGQRTAAGGGLPDPDDTWQYIDEQGNEMGYFDSAEKAEMDSVRQPGANYTWRKVPADEVSSFNNWYGEQSYAQASRRTAAEGGATCSVCGDAIASDPDGTYHHDNGEKHDHEAKAGGSKESSRRTAAEYYDDLGPGFTQNSFPEGDKREVARWSTKGGKYTLVVTQDKWGYNYDLYDRQWDTPRSSGGFNADSDDAAIAEIESRKARGWLDAGLTRSTASRRTATEVPVKDPSDDGAAGSTLPDAVDPTDAPETFDDNTLTGDGSGPVTDVGGGGGGTESAFSKYVRDASKTAAFRQRVEAGRRPFVRSEGAKTAMPAPADVGVSVGDFFRNTWGYDQTNVDFYEVVGLTGAGVRVRQVWNKRLSSDGYGSDSVVPDPGNYRGEPLLKKIKTMSGGSGGDRVYLSMESGWCEKWDGTPQRETSFGWGH